MHVTSHAQELMHQVPRLHDRLPVHETVQRPLPQKIAPQQLSLPVHTTRHGVLAGHTTSSLHDPFAVHAMTQTPSWHVPGQSEPQSGSGASGIPASIGGMLASGGGVPESSFGMPVSTGGTRVSIGDPPSSGRAPSPPGWKHCPTTPAEAHQPSEPQLWLGAHSAVAVHRTTHSPYRGS